MKHELKIWPQYYGPVAEGLKTFEIRKNDRGFQAGDDVVLREYNPEEAVEIGPHPETWIKKGPTGYTQSTPLKFRIGYVLPIDAERVVFSLVKP